jgi:hypothetical protein
VGAMTGRVLSRSKSGQGAVTEFTESDDERRLRLTTAASEARRKFNLTPGQRQTLRRAIAARGRRST